MGGTASWARRPRAVGARAAWVLGDAKGITWTQVGGELLNIEAVAMPGKGQQIKTGSLGDVMQESIQAALTVVRSRSESLGIDSEFFETSDLHCGFSSITKLILSLI